MVAGAQAWTQFRTCNDAYEEDVKSMTRWGGIYAYGTRLGPCNALMPGDTFIVNFNFSSFPPRGQNRTADNIFE
jgi:hypothetical protein